MPLHMIKSDLLTLSVDAIVNPTNSRYEATGGLDLAIRKAAGEELSSYLATLPPLSVGEVRESEGFALPCRYILHTVGPLWQGGDMGEEQALAFCYQNALLRAHALGCESVAFPLIASGALGYPKDRVMKLATASIAEFLCDHEMTVYLSVFSKDEFALDRRLERSLLHYVTVHTCRSTCEERSIRGMACENVSYQRKIPPKAQMNANYCIAPPLTANALVVKLDRSFAEELFCLIDQKGLTDVECYKRSNVDKKTFSKIKCNKNYRPSKETAVSFAIGLHLTINEAERLLSTAGLCLSPSYTFDVIIRYFLTYGCYNTIHDVNEALYQYDQITLGV